MASAAGPFELGRIEAGLSMPELWLRYFALGGMSSPLELEAVLLGALLATDHEGSVIAVALDERLAELDGRRGPSTGPDPGWS